MYGLQKGKQMGEVSEQVVFFSCFLVLLITDINTICIFIFLNDVGSRDENHTAGAICVQVRHLCTVLYHCPLGELVLNLFSRNMILRFHKAASF